MTRYEIAVRDNGRSLYLVGYTPRISKRGLLDAMRRRGETVIAVLGITEADVLTFTTKPRPYCQVGGWWIGFTGRTQRDAETEGELPYIGRAKPDPETELRALWTAQGVPPERQDALIRDIEAKARPEYLAGLFPARPTVDLP